MDLVLEFLYFFKVVVFKIDGRTGQGGQRVLEFAHGAFDGDPLAWSDDRTTALDVHHGVNVPVTRTTGFQDNLEVIGLADFQTYGTRHQLATDVGRLADEDRAGDTDVEERGFRGINGFGPAFEDVELAGDFNIFIDLDDFLGPLQVVPVDGTHTHEGSLGLFTVGGSVRCVGAGRGYGSQQADHSPVFE